MTVVTVMTCVGDRLRIELSDLHEDAWGWTLSCCRGDRETAMEVLHEVYVKVLDGRARFKGRSSLKTFLFGVIRLTARNHRRRARLTSFLFVPIEATGVERHAAPQIKNESCRDAVRIAIENLLSLRGCA